jgi:phage-related protein
MPTIETLTVAVDTKTSAFSTGLKVVAGGLAALAAGAGYAFAQFQESEKISAQTGAVLKSTGNAANVSAGQVTNLADALAEKSGIDDEAIQSGENMILTFKNIANQAGAGNDIFNQTTKAVLDMSVAMDQDMKSSAIQVGKALNDPIAGMSALSRVGVQFTDEQKSQIEQLVKHNNLLGAQKIILQELTSEFGGSAAAQATETGKMQVALGNLAESIGKLLAPAVTFLVNKLMDLVQWLQGNVGPAFRAVAEWVQNVWEKVKPFAEVVGNELVKAWHAVQQEFTQLLPDLKKLWTALQPLLKVVGEVIGVVLILALKALPTAIHAIGGMIDAVVKIETALSKVINAVGSFVGKVIEWFSRLPEAVRTQLDRVNEALGGWPARILGILKGAATLLFNVGRDIILGLWHGMQSVWSGVTSWLHNALDSISGIAKSLLGIGSPSKVFEDIGKNVTLGFQKGLRSGFGGAGSAMSAFGDVGFGGAVAPAGGNVTVNIGTLLGGSPAEVARVIQSELIKLGRRNAGTGL